MPAQRVSAHSEEAAWAPINGEWRRLHGNFADRGLSIEWHDFTLEKELSWSESIHPGSLEICLNLSGNARVRSGKKEYSFGDRTVAVYTSESTTSAIREPGCRHQFLTVEASREFLCEHLGGNLASLQPAMRAFVSDKRRKTFEAEVREMTQSEYTAFASWPTPPLCPAAHALWYEAKVLGLLASLCFTP